MHQGDECLIYTNIYSILILLVYLDCNIVVFIIYLACGFCHVHVHFLFNVLNAKGIDKTQLYTGLCNLTLTSSTHFHKYCNIILCLYESMQQNHSVK